MKIFIRCIQTKMKSKLKDCNPSILQHDTLMTWEWEFMNKDEIRERCVECEKKSICLQIVDLLSNKQYQKALDLLRITNESDW